MTRWLACLLASVVLLRCASSADAQERAGQVLLVKNGQARCVVVTTKQPSSDVASAIADLVRCIKVMSGATVSVVYDQADAPDGFVPIRIGIDNKDPFLSKAGRNQAFVLRVSKQAVMISGTSPGVSGTMFGVYDFLERLGVRWFMPGELGEVIPRHKTVVLPFMEKQAKPDFVGRTIQYSGDYPAGGQTEIWERRVKLRPTPGIPGSHAFRKWMPKEKYFEKHPEYYALINGKRDPSQLCTSKREVVDLFCRTILTRLREHPEQVPKFESTFMIPIGPNDGSAFCECDPCRALDTGDFDPARNSISVTDRMIVFFNQVAQRVGKDYPEAKYSFYIYSAHRRPPLKAVPHEKLVGMIAPLRMCVIHGPDQKQCPERSVEFPDLMKDWTDLPLEIWNRDYGTILYGGGAFPLSLTHRWRAEVPLCKKLGIKGFRVETWVCWAGQMLDPYLMAKLWWDADLDVDALIDDYFTKFYGPAAKPMYRYWKLMSEAMATTEYHSVALTGSNMYYWYPPRLATKAGKELSKAAKLARSDIQKKRVQIAVLSHDALMNYVLMHQQMNEGQFEKAAKSWRKMRQICDGLNSGEFPLVDPYALFRLYIDWNKGSAQGRPNYTEYAAERVSGANELVAMLPDIWLSQPDPMNIGEDQQWYSPDVFSKLDWSKRSTHTSIRNQGFRNYNGSMWYRCELDVPKRFDSRTIRLYFLGVNKYSTVWVNGIKLGKLPRRHPWEFDVSEQIIAGQKNLITVKANYDGYGHGIYRPVILWSAKTLVPVQEQ